MPLYLINIRELKFLAALVNAEDEIDAKLTVPNLFQNEILDLGGGQTDISAELLLCEECNTILEQESSMTASCPKCGKRFSLYERYEA
jgi:rubrerythrin